jgi:ATP-binding cassette subfamily B protein
MAPRQPSVFRQLLFIFKKLLAYNRNQTLLYCFLIVLTGVLPQIDAFATGKLIDVTLNAASTSNLSTAEILKQTLPMLALVISLFVLLKFIYDYQSYVSQSFELKLQNFKDLLNFGSLVNLQPHVYEDSEFITTKNIVEYNIWKISNIIFLSISVVGALIANTFIVVVFLAYNPIILLSALASLVAPALVRLKFGKQVWGIWDSLSEDKIIYGMYRSPLYVDEAAKAAETKVFGFGSYLLNKFLNINDKFLDALVVNEKKRFALLCISRVVEYSFVGVGYYSILQLVLNGTIGVGSLYFLITLYTALRASLAHTVEQTTSILADIPFVRSLYKYLTFKPKYEVPDGTALIEKHSPEIEFKDVWFKYPNTDRWILSGVSFKIDKNSDIAFVGKNGAGKSTIVKLILRIYDATSGEILVNGQNIKNLSIADYYKQIGILAQDFHKFRFTVGESISLGDVSVTKDVDDRVINASKKSQAHEFISQYDKGYSTYLTREISGGITPSGGQMQKIGIARVFFKNPNLIILDEPTSAIDALAEEQIFANIKEESKEKTVVIISHRFATVKKADYIYVLDEGVIKEQGTHKTLMKEKGLYNQMYEAQHA